MNGVIKTIRQTQQVSDKFSKREFVVIDSSDEKYPQDILFELKQDKTSLLDNVMEGQDVEVSFNLRGREWTSPQGDVKYFNTLNAFKIDVIGGSVAPVPVIDMSSNDEDLPF